MATNTKKTNKNVKAEKVVKTTKHKVFVTYPVGDFLIRVKNTAKSNKSEARAPYTKLIEQVAKVLKSEGYVDSIDIKDGELVIKLTMRHKETHLLGIELVSTPGLRQYVGVDELRAYRGPEFYVISTPLGVLSSKVAIKKNVGGEVIAKVW